ncbi:hypothetical protein I8751_20020 [Nostocaceae cyanobacterium CENA357]|uniref:Uncharacterized protein n=1 Tax=Atlanticothrix silvestris CENA357 TaxID=1725252 RepID=A0A8J7L4B0_9CYAN|nr:hypothetical protein [Atlanticothrix silvestris]MBH8554606.1 hypothetical protein [Atlanticothrix silvestris CENA357]
MKSTFQGITLLFSSVAVALSVCQSATAQPIGLDVGGRYRIPPGQEPEYLRYQLEHNNDLRQIQVIPDCSVGFGLGCNKTGTVLEQIVRSNGGPSYQEMLVRAAGGPENYRNFATFYGNDPNLDQIPYASFWQEPSPSIVDRYQYVLGQSVSRNPVQGLGTVTQNFAWAPLSRGNNSLSARDGLLDFKYSYGRVLLNEVAKVPNLKQQISSLDLPPDMTKYYFNTISSGLQALNTGNEQRLQDSILKIFSFPYSPPSIVSGEFGRVPINPPNQVSEGIPLPGEAISINPVLSEGVAIDAVPDTSLAFEDFLQPAAGGFNFPFLPVLGGIGLLALVLSLGGGDDGDSSSSQPIPPGVDIPPGVIVPPPSPPVCDDTPGGNGQVVGVPPCNTYVPPPAPEVKRVIEPSTLKAVVLLTLMMCILSRKHRAKQIGGLVK